MPTWFLPPDFTFTPTKLPLGLVLSHPTDPTDILAHPSSSSSPVSPSPFRTTTTTSTTTTYSQLLPAEAAPLVETNHTHTTALSTSTGLSLLARFLDNLLSGSASLTRSRRDALEYGPVDHEVRTFATAPDGAPLLRAVVALPRVRDHMRGSLFGTRPVYMVCGLRVARSSFRVERVRERALAGEVGVEVPVGVVPIDVGGGVAGSRERVTVDSYETAPGIVFAYQLCVIRTKKGKGEGEEGEGAIARGKLFASRNAFMTGDGRQEEEEEMELVDVNEEVLEEDYDVQAEYEVEGFGEDDSCVVFN